MVRASRGLVTLDDVIQLVDRDVVPRHLQEFKHWEPPFFLRVVAPKQKVLDTKTLVQFRAMIPPAQLRGGSFDKAYRGSERQAVFREWVVGVVQHERPGPGCACGCGASSVPFR
jgi:hypothetical protein